MYSSPGIDVTVADSMTIALLTSALVKDTEYGVALAAQMGQESGLGALARDAFRKTVDAGFAGLSESKVIDTLGQ